MFHCFNVCLDYFACLRSGSCLRFCFRCVLWFVLLLCLWLINSVVLH